jgi:hypothetical protein
MVRCGNNLVGPVSLELIERGLEAGKIPADAEMTHLRGSEWRPVAEIYPALVAAARPVPPAPALAHPALAPLAVPPAPPSYRYLEEPVSIPKQGLMAAMFG